MDRRQESLHAINGSSNQTATADIETRPIPSSAVRTLGAEPVSAKRRNRAILVQLGLLAVVVIVETGLMLMSFVPNSIAIRLGWSATNGPFPTSVAPLISALFYLTPFIAGLLARQWEVALFAATLPVWLSLGVYTVAATPQNGIFALTSGAHPSYLVGTLELFAVLGGFGWLMRRVWPLITQGIVRGS